MVHRKMKMRKLRLTVSNFARAQRLPMKHFNNYPPLWNPSPAQAYVNF